MHHHTGPNQIGGKQTYLRECAPHIIAYQTGLSSLRRAVKQRSYTGNSPERALPVPPWLRGGRRAAKRRRRRRRSGAAELGLGRKWRRGGNPREQLIAEREGLGRNLQKSPCIIVLRALIPNRASVKAGPNGLLFPRPMFPWAWPAKFQLLERPFAVTP